MSFKIEDTFHQSMRKMLQFFFWEMSCFPKLLSTKITALPSIYSKCSKMDIILNKVEKILQDLKN